MDEIAEKTANADIKVNFTTASTDSAAPLPSTKVHLLPCRINHNGPANVETYFHYEPHKAASGEHQTTEDKQYWNAHFRGRQLTGRKIALPSHMTGIVLEGDDTLPPTPHQKKTKSAINKENVNMNTPTDTTSTSKQITWTVAQCNNNTSSSTPPAESDQSFDSLYIWNRDLDKHENDAVIAALHEWIPAAHVLHAPLVPL